MLQDAYSIVRLLPHRYPFLLIDKVIELKREKGIVALKNISINEHFFNGHFYNKKIMPGVLILESILQAAAFYVIYNNQTHKYNTIAHLVSLDRVRFRRFVLPGDAIYLQVKQLSMRSTAYKMSGIAIECGCLVVEMVFTMLLKHH